MDSQKVFILFFTIFAASVFSKPYSSIDVLETKDLIFPKESDLVKRTANDEGSNDVSELSIQKISLSSLIDNIESGLLRTALSVDSVASDPNAKVEVVTTPHSVNKRSTVEQDNTATSGNNPIIVLQTTEKVLADDAVPAHVVIDRVSVYKAPASGASLFPTFHLQETLVSGDTGEVIAEVEEDQYFFGTTTGKSSDSSSSESSEESSESSESKETTTLNRVPITSSTTNQPPITSSTTSQPSSSSSPSVTVVAEKEITNQISSSSPSSSSSTSTTTTVLFPVDEDKIVEKELKEKVAEVEADPVILTARV